METETMDKLEVIKGLAPMMAELRRTYKMISKTGLEALDFVMLRVNDETQPDFTIDYWIEFWRENNARLEKISQHSHGIAEVFSELTNSVCKDLEIVYYQEED